MRKYLPLAAVAAALLALAGIAAAMLVNRDTQQPTAAVTTPTVSASPTPTLSGTDAGTDNSGNSIADDGTLTAEELQSQWEPVVTAFAKAFTNTTGGHKAWLARLTSDHSQLTDAVAKALDTVDTANVPAGKLESVTLVTSDQYTASAKVTYDTGWSMIVTVNTDGIDWRIASYDKLDEG